ncbi:MAG TPA: hypothetical protein VNR87_17535 [Flavisolibacter sp.]|nr:hypothetical protein [Flavisolibacter sp.]
MKNFKEKLAVENGNYELEFIRIRAPRGWKFFISLSRGGELLVSFDMVEDGHTWKIVPPVPQWVLEKETALSEIIKNHL